VQKLTFSTPHTYIEANKPSTEITPVYNYKKDENPCAVLVLIAIAETQ